MNPLYYTMYKAFQRDRKQKKYTSEYDDNKDLPKCVKYVIIGFIICVFVLILV